jgi:spermidine synthase
LLSDDRIVEYGYKEVLFSQQSPFQLIEIVDTVDFGRLLLLDGLTNLAELDTEAYTHTLMNLPHEDYKV